MLQREWDQNAGLHRLRRRPLHRRQLLWFSAFELPKNAHLSDAQGQGYQDAGLHRLRRLVNDQRVDRPRHARKDAAARKTQRGANDVRLVQNFRLDPFPLRLLRPRLRILKSARRVVKVTRDPLACRCPQTQRGTDDICHVQGLGLNALLLRFLSPLLCVLKVKGNTEFRIYTLRV